jgi:hypothetical protein
LGPSLCSMRNLLLIFSLISAPDALAALMSVGFNMQRRYYMLALTVNRQLLTVNG